MTDLGNRVDDLAVEYQRWTQRVHDTHDAVRYTYGSRAGDWAIADLVAVHVILQMLEKPQVFRYQGLPYSARIGSLAGPLLNGEAKRSADALGDLGRHPAAPHARPEMVWQLSCVHSCTDVQPRKWRNEWAAPAVNRPSFERWRRPTCDVRDATASGRQPQTEAETVWSKRCADVVSTVYGFRRQSNAGEDLYERASANRLQFWAEQAREL